MRLSVANTRSQRAVLCRFVGMDFRELLFQRLSGKSYARANLLTISRVIAT